jgi:hypothetical protein
MNFKSGYRLLAILATDQNYLKKLQYFGSGI